MLFLLSEVRKKVNKISRKSKLVNVIAGIVCITQREFYPSVQKYKEI